jgi:hypothetical protein
MGSPGAFLNPGRAAMLLESAATANPQRVFLDASPAPRSNTRPLRRISPSRTLSAPILHSGARMAR